MLLLVAVAGGLAWNQYQAAQRTALGNERARAVLAGSVIDTYFRGELAALRAIAGSPSVVEPRRPRHEASTSRASSAATARAFSAGLGWLDAHGHARGSRRIRGAVARRLDLSDRSYFWNVARDGQAVRERRHRRAARTARA